MNEEDLEKFLRADAIRKASGMSETDRIDFLIAKMDEEEKSAIQQRWKDSAKLRNCILIALCFLLFFMAFLT